MTFVDLIEAKITEQLNAYIEGLSYGVSDFPQYQRQCGVIQGLREALVIIDDLVKQQQQDDDN